MINVELAADEIGGTRNPEAAVVDEISRLVDAQLAAGEAVPPKPPRCGDTVLTGDAGTGKTQLLRKALLHLVAEYGPGEVRLVFGAGGSGPLAEELAALPHTAGSYCGLKADPESFLKCLRRERTRRSRFRRSGRGLELPRLLVVIDDFESMGEMRPDLRRILSRIEPWGWFSANLLMALRQIDPHSWQACSITPHRIHLGGNDTLSEFPRAMQTWAHQRVADQATLWCTRSWKSNIPANVFAEESREVTAAAICGAVGLPVTPEAGHDYAARYADNPLPAASLPHGALVSDAKVGDLALRTVHATNTDPDRALKETKLPYMAGTAFVVEAVWITGQHTAPGLGTLAGTRKDRELAVRVSVRGADLDTGRVEAAIRTVDPDTRYPDGARYAALWQEVTDQLRGLGR